MSTKFSFTDLQTKILTNFSGINPSILIEPDKLSVMNDTKSVIGLYEYEKPFSFEPWGLYNTQDFLTIHSALTKPEIEKVDGKLIIYITGANNDRIRYFTTAESMVPSVPNIEANFKTLKTILDFAIPADKLALINKMSSILKNKYLFFETDKKIIRITLGDELTSSGNNYEIEIEDNIKVNELEEALKLPMIDFKVLPGEYEIQIGESPKGKKMSKWTNLNNVVYYIATAK